MPTIYCRHIQANGRRCRSIALANQTNCYWHHDLARRHRRLNPTNADLPAIVPDHHRDVAMLRENPTLAKYYGVDHLQGPLAFDFPALEDGASIQVALSMLLSALGSNRLDPKRAAPMLYLLQVACNNTRNLDARPSHVVQDTVLDEAGCEIAPDEDPEEVFVSQQIIQEIQEAEQRRRIRDGEDEDDEEEDDLFD